jgi:hypothetical protein
MIYLASPYWHPEPVIRNQRFRAACRATAQMIRQGITVFSPVVYGHALVGEGLPGDWSFWEGHDAEYSCSATRSWSCRWTGGRRAKACGKK